MADEDDELEAEDGFDSDAETDDEVGDDLEDVVVIDGDGDEADNDDVDNEEEEAVAVKPATRGGTRKKRTEAESLHTVAAREDLRNQLANDVEAFLKRGGAIQDVAQDERADPPKKPESNYGRGSI